MIEKTILHLCADIGSDSKPYKDAGYNVICVGKNTDVRTYTPPEEVYGIIANPPCTMFSFARVGAKAPRDLVQGMELIDACLRIIWKCQQRVISNKTKKPYLKFWCIENPKAGLEWFLGKATFLYSPWEYGDTYQKKTALWGYFNNPPKSVFQKPTNLKKFDSLKNAEIHPEYKQLTRTDRRSVCSAKFAQAFFEANP